MASSTITFTRDQVSGSPVTVSFILAGSATYGTDYTISGANTVNATGGTIIIAANNTTSTMVVNTVPDSNKEEDESIIITPISGVGYTAQTSVFLTILNDEFVNLTYVADGDSSGLFYYLGTNRQTAAWTLINIESNVNVIYDGIVSVGSNTRIFDRNPTNIIRITNNGSLTASIFFNLLTYRMAINRYTLRGGSPASPIEWPRNWKIQGSNDFAATFNTANMLLLNWTDIDTQVNNTTVNTPGQFLTITPNGNTTTAFQYLRYVQVGQNFGTIPVVNLGEIEFYGTYY